MTTPKRRAQLRESQRRLAEKRRREGQMRKSYWATREQHERIKRMLSDG